jgi:protein-disulfide isomerase
VLALKTEGESRKKFGVKSTPTLFVNGQMQCGDMSIEELMRAIDPLIRAESREDRQAVIRSA